MTTPTHLAVSAGVFVALSQVPGIDATYTDLALIAGANLIDLDHLLSRPIYDPKRNSFTAHILHKQWRAVSIISVGMLFIRPIAFLGIGLLLHFFLDYLYNKREHIS